MARRPSAALSATAPTALTHVAERVEGRATAFFEAESARWLDIDPDLAEPVDLLGHMVGGGGKRLRPAFCYWAHVAGGGDPDDPRVIDIGAGFELLHAFALLHDDVMDGSSTRRGAPTAHLRFQQQHQIAAWRGESRRFGEGAAVLVGDLAHAYADQVVAAALMGHPASQRVQAIWHELRVELNMGQYLDLLGTARADRDPGMARRISRYKSGKYTVERPLDIGWALAANVATPLNRLGDYGRPLGEAFQLRDDVLGSFGNPERTGKPVGQDLREGKLTPLLAYATAHATPAQARVLALVGTPNLADADLSAAQQVLVDTGALADAEHRISRCADAAVDALEDAGITSAAHKALLDLAHFVADRSA